MSEERYAYMISMPHHRSTTRKPMTMIGRAAQFGAFRALVGYEEEIAETGRLTDKRIILDEYVQAQINRKLQYLHDRHMQTENVSLTYFVPDAKKEGGAYKTKTGTVRKIKVFEGVVQFTDGAEVPIHDIVAIAGEAFEKIEEPL